MKNKIFFIVFMAVMSAITSCIINYDGNSTSGSFNYNLRGTWESTLTPKVTLEIGYNSIKINGTIQTVTVLGTIVHYPLLTNYQGLQDIELKGHSEETKNEYNDKEGLIYISVSGSWEDPIPYIYWPAGSDKMLTLGTGDNKIYFKRQSNS